MSSHLKKMALLLALLLSTNGAAGAQQAASDAGPADQLCGPAQLSGQYECVASVPLSEEEVRVSLAYLAAPSKDAAADDKGLRPVQAARRD